MRSFQDVFTFVVGVIPVFDINIFSIQYAQGKDLGDLAGLAALAAPRRAARGRSGDILLMMLLLASEAPFSAGNIRDYLSRQADWYFNTPGTVTNGIRTLVEAINKDLMTRNSRRTREGTRIAGHIQVAVLRRDLLYTTRVGQAQTLILQRESVERSINGDSNRYGLGSSQTISLQYTQTEIQAGDLLVFAPALPEGWSDEAMRNSPQLGPEALKRRFFNLAGDSLTAAVFQFQPGNGNIHLQHLPVPAWKQPAPAAGESTPSSIPAETRPEELSQPEPAANPPEAGEINAVVSEESAEQVEPTLPPANEPSLESAGVELTPDQEAAPSDFQQYPASLEPDNEKPGLVVATPVARQQPHVKHTRPAEKKAAAGDDWVVSLAKWWVNARQKIHHSSEGAKNFTHRLVPAASQGLSPWMMALIAILVPLIVVGAGTSIYLRTGRTSQFQAFFIQAQQYAAIAEQSDRDNAGKLNALQQAVEFLDKAEKYGQNEDSIALRAYIQQTLDKMEGIQRIRFHSIVEGMIPANISITQIAATQGDVYLLDGTTGGVIRLVETSGGYNIDAAFDCGPQQTQDGISNMRVIDLAALPSGFVDGATMVGVDAHGKLRFCTPGKPQTTQSLGTPDSGWGEIRALAMDGSRLYILDPKNNGVYYYDKEGTSFEGKPHLFFDAEIPALSDVIDMEANKDELFLLRSDGRMTTCTYSALKAYKKTECTEPALYTDIRQGRESKVEALPGATFIQMRMTGAPDPSLYLLDSVKQAVYHLSLKRSLQRVVYPAGEYGAVINKGGVTAMTVQTGRNIFLAFGNDIFVAEIP